MQTVSMKTFVITILCILALWWYADEVRLNVIKEKFDDIAHEIENAKEEIVELANENDNLVLSYDKEYNTELIYDMNKSDGFEQIFSNLSDHISEIIE